MEKKGFTLIELLAVIAILSILLIIAIPGVLEMFTNGKKNTFVDQAQSIYKTAQNEYMADQLEGVSDAKYCYISGDTNTDDNLTLSGNSSVYYYVSFTSAGKVDKFKISDASYSITIDDNNDIQVTDIKASAIDTTLTAVTCE